MKNAWQGNSKLKHRFARVEAGNRRGSFLVDVMRMGTAIWLTAWPISRSCGRVQRCVQPTLRTRPMKQARYSITLLPRKRTWAGVSIWWEGVWCWHDISTGQLYCGCHNYCGLLHAYPEHCAPPTVYCPLPTAHNPPPTTIIHCHDSRLS